MAETIKDWVVLKCDCGGDLFMPLVKLRFRDGSGTSSEAAGHQCIACHGLVDNARMVKLIEISRLQRQLKETQAELDAKQETPAARR